MNPTANRQAICTNVFGFFSFCEVVFFGLGLQQHGNSITRSFGSVVIIINIDIKDYFDQFNLVSKWFFLAQ